MKTNDLDLLYSAIKAVLDGGARMSEDITRPSGSVQGGSIIAPRWWWILRGAIERSSIERSTPISDVWEP